MQAIKTSDLQDQSDFLLLEDKELCDAQKKNPGMAAADSQKLSENE